MKLLALAFLTGVMCHPNIDPELSKEFIEFANNFEFLEDAAVTERRIKEFTRLQNDHKESKGDHKRGPPRFEKPNPEDALRFSSIDHHSDRTDITPDITLDKLFANGSTVLQPEATEGPFYVGGELVRSDITDGEPGIPLWVSANFYDISTGNPVEMYWEIWHCNTTGAYSGVDSPMNSNGDNLLDDTFLRGLQKTDKNGAATFKTIFPGHYGGRAVHIHMMAHIDATEYENGTIGLGENGSSGHIAHVGQFFFDDDLVDKVDKADPYTSNKHPRTANKDDREVGMLSKAGSPDPFVKYVFLGDNIEDGVYAWISIGIDASASYKPRMAAYRTEEGGVSVPRGPKEGERSPPLHDDKDGKKIPPPHKGKDKKKGPGKHVPPPPPGEGKDGKRGPGKHVPPPPPHKGQGGKHGPGKVPPPPPPPGKGKDGKHGKVPPPPPGKGGPGGPKDGKHEPSNPKDGKKQPPGNKYDDKTPGESPGGRRGPGKHSPPPPVMDKPPHFGKNRPGRPPKNPKYPKAGLKGKGTKTHKKGGNKDKPNQFRDKPMGPPPPDRQRQPNCTDRGRREPPKNWLGMILEKLSATIF